MANWERLTSLQIRKMAKECGVCIVPIGVMERHGDHLPLGTDFLSAHKVAQLAAEKEEAVVFPPYFFGQIYEARCFDGTINLPPAMLIDLLQHLIDEIARNGFKKIILYNWHGGNWNMLRYFVQSQLYQPRDYSLYLFADGFLYHGRHIKESVLEIVDEYHGHANEWETAIMMAIDDEAVDRTAMDYPDGAGEPLGRLSALEGSETPVNWYADHPNHYHGDCRAATRENGEKLLALHADHLSEYIRAVKDDTVAPALQKEFEERVKHLDD